MAPLTNTYTLIARDPHTRMMGIATASKSLAVGSVVPHLRAGIGAVVTQHQSDPRLALAILEDLEAGVDPKDAIERALRFFGDAEHRQVAVLPAQPQPGQTAFLAYTGAGCHNFAGQRATEDLIVIGNTLKSEQVLLDGERGYHASVSPHLAERLVEGLLACERAGGDVRGKQSAALVLVGPQVNQPALVDLRVDDHPDAPAELHRIYILFRRQFGTSVLPRVKAAEFAP